MFKQTKVCAGLMLAISGGLLVGMQPASAQQRVEITGSSIKRSINDEGALPITVLKVEDLRQAGVTSVEAVVQLVTASQSSTSSINSIGSGTGGATYANLRGLGSNKTLILLNGRRVAAFAFGVDAVDLNAIPFAVLERVEVLRDGASALYGTDAVGGVINFITRRNYKGVGLTLEASRPTAAGGRSDRASFLAGGGDLEADGGSGWFSIDHQNRGRIRALDREFAKTGIIPSRGVNGNSGTTFPGNFSQNVGLDKNSVSGNLTAPACKAPLSQVNPSNNKACVFDFSATIDIVPDVTQDTLASRFNFKMFKDSLLSVELVSTDNKTVARVAPDPVGGIAILPSNPFYPHGFANLDETKSVTAGWRMVPAGNRTNESNSHADRLVLDLSGTVAGLDYRAGMYYTDNTASDAATDGYVNAPFVRAQVAAGNITPFAEANAAQLAIIEQAKRKGTFSTAQGKTKGIDFRLGKDLWAMGGGNAAVSMGIELRHEFYRNDTDDAVVLAIPSAGRSPSHTGGTRMVKAIAAELLLPVTKQIEVSLQARADEYSDAGSTFNPKVGIRFQPSKELLFRGSYNTGFRAPTLDDLYSAQSVTFASSNSNDPLLCPGGTADVSKGGVQSRDCGLQVQVLNGGNPALKPEKSTTFGFGMAFEPMKDLTFTVDYFNVKLTQTINALPQESIIANPAQYAAKYVRCKDLSVAAQTDLNRCLADNVNSNAIAYLITLTDNLGKTETSGLDFSAGYSTRLGNMGNVDLSWNGTWVQSYKYQLSPTDPMKENVSIYSDGSPVFRWQHSVSAAWTLGNWSTRLGVRHKTGYYDMNNPSTVVGGPSFYGDVSSYTLVDASVTAMPMKGLSVTVGLKNLFDTSPPFSNQSTRSQRGYDPRYSDPYGRTLFARLGFGF